MAEPKNPFAGGYARLAQLKRERERADAREIASVTESPAVTKTPPVSVSVPVAETASAPKTAPAADRGQPMTQAGAGLQTAPVAKPGALRVPDKAGYLELPHAISDNLMPLLTPNEQAVYHRLYRLTVGHAREECTVGYHALARACNINWRTAMRVVEKLIGYGLIAHVGTDLTNVNQKERGNRYKLLPFTASGAPVLKSGGAKRAEAARKPAPVALTGMKENMKESMKSPLYQIREIGAQLHERHRGEANYSRADLRADVKAVCAEQGIGYDDALIEEALGKVGL